RRAYVRVNHERLSRLVRLGGRLVLEDTEIDRRELQRFKQGVQGCELDLLRRLARLASLEPVESGRRERVAYCLHTPPEFCHGKDALLRHGHTKTPLDRHWSCLPIAS